jgi:hypothetical protein
VGLFVVCCVLFICGLIKMTSFPYSSTGIRLCLSELSTCAQPIRHPYPIYTSIYRYPGIKRQHTILPYAIYHMTYARWQMADGRCGVLRTVSKSPRISVSEESQNPRIPESQNLSPRISGALQLCPPSQPQSSPSARRPPRPAVCTGSSSHL